MAQRYEYDKLEPGWIRLLQIQSVEPEVVLRVETVALDSDPIYLALSYLHGDDNRPTRIKAANPVQIDSGSLEVTVTLRNALRSLRSFVGAHIWIDKLSINQQDDTEKAHQVQAMGRIYHQARTVLLWVGSSHGYDGEVVLRGVADYGGAARRAGILSLATEHLRAWPDVGDDPAALATKDAILALIQRIDNDTVADASDHGHRKVMLNRLLQRTFCGRVWFKLELTLARRILMVCGDETVDIDDCFALVLLYGLLLRRDTHPHDRRYGTRLLGPLAGTNLDAAFGPMRHTSWGFLYLGVCRVLADRRRYRRSGLDALHDLLHQSYVHADPQWSLQCADGRDRVWALLGLARDAAELGLEVRYDVGCSEVYKATARALLRQGRVDVLKWCRTRELQEPSWVPDLAQPVLNPWTEDVDGRSLFCASGGALRQPSALFDHDGASPPEFIRLHGAVVDTVSELGPYWSAQHRAARLFNREEFLQISIRLSGFLARSRYPPEQHDDAIWRIPVGDKELVDDDYGVPCRVVRATDGSREQHLALMAQVLEDGHEEDGRRGGGGDADPVAGQVGSYGACMERNYMTRPLLTRDGYVGMGPSVMEEGDVVVVLWGGTTPFVLRPRPGNQGGYLLVGEAYIYGIMDGEFVNGTDVVPQVFELW